MRCQFGKNTLIRDEKDNLYIINDKGETIWSINQLNKIPDSVTILDIIDDRTIEFSTFNGMRYRFDVIDLKILERKIVK